LRQDSLGLIFTLKMKPIKRTTGRYKWVVYAPPGFQGVPKRRPYRFIAKEQAYAFCANVERWQLDKRGGTTSLAVTDAEKNWLGFLKNELDGNLSLLPTIVAHYKKTAALPNKATVHELCERWLAWKEQQGLNVRTIRSDIKSKLTYFSAVHGDMYAHEVTPALLQKFLVTIPGNWTRKGYHKWLSQMFGWAKIQHLVGINPFDDLDVPQTPLGEPPIYTIENAKKLLAAADKQHPELLPWLILGGWNFCRTCELVPAYAGDPVLQWSDFLLDRPDPQIYIRPEVAKQTRSDSGCSRYIPVMPAAAYWLRDHLKKSGPVVPFGTERKHGIAKAKLFTAAGVLPVDNGLRHSCISYWLAKDPENGVAATAKFAGNSEAISRRHYTKALTPDMGQTWWNLERKNIISH
jgi:integrase